MNAVENDAARAFEIFVFRLAMREIHGARNAESPVTHDLLQNLVAALPAPVRRQHGIQRHGAVVMKADPVVWEYGIRLGRIRTVGYDEDLHACSLQACRQTLELAQHNIL